MNTIDLNADAGESFGIWRVADEAALFPLLSSVNVACGFHAGDPVTMQGVLELAQQQQLAIGAHPGYNDKVGFGRRALAASFAEIYGDTLYQLGALTAFLRVAGLPLHHVKAHGALYLQMASEPKIAEAFMSAVAAFDSSLPVVVLAGAGGKIMREAASKAGLRAIGEAFPDRAYLANGQLAPRRLQNSVLHEPETIADRARALATGDPLKALDGGTVSIQAETLCLHGDNAAAVATARAIRHKLEAAGIKIHRF